MKPLSLPSKILAIGKNYAAHKLEMGGTPEKLAKPLFFLKPPSSIVHEGQQIVRPRACKDLHHEVELALVISDRARHVKPEDWKRYIRGYALALDMTARDLQAEAKKTGSPWTEAKGFDTLLPLSREIPAEEVDAVGGPHSLELWLSVDGVMKQQGSSSMMMHSIGELLAYCSSVMTLLPGDLILTGTPSGVGPVLPGQTIRCGLRSGSVSGGVTLVEMAFPVVDEDSGELR